MLFSFYIKSKSDNFAIKKRHKCRHKTEIVKHVDKLKALSDVEHLENNSKYLFINTKAPNPCKDGNGVDNAFLNC